MADTPTAGPGAWIRSSVAGGAAIACFVWLLAAGGASGWADEVAATPGPEGQEYRFAGEFGLSVHRVGDSIVVRWMTDEPAAGVLEVRTGGGEAVHRDTTQVWPSHRSTFATPAEDSIQLVYGALDDAGDARHRTWIHLAERAPRPVRVTGVDSLYVMADIHGEYDQMVGILLNAGLIDEELRWTGGRRHLVALGDMMSRGPEVTPVLWFLYRLEREAEASGGRVHVLLGNHEIMVLLSDLRYVHYREKWLATSYQLDYDRMFDPRESVLGRWLAEAPAILQVDDVLLAHGGVSSDQLAFTVESHRDTLAAYVAEDLFHLWGDTTVVIDIDPISFNRRYDFFWGDRSVFWYRGYSFSDTLAAELDSVLQHFDSRLHVMGHTPVPGIREVYDGRMILANPLPLGDEILLLVRDREGGTWDRKRVQREGPPLPLEVGHPAEPVATDPPGS
jgi:hypothetical protein